MRVYYINKKKILYHNTFNLETAMRLAGAIKQLGLPVWIEKGLAHR